MSMMDELSEHFAPALNTRIGSNEKYGRASAELSAFCEQELTHEQAEKLNDIIGKLIDSVAAVNSRAGLKLGARIIAGLLTDDS